ncbi:WD40-repeat-containing domain protein [Mycena metata]|uniref:WD40-repeat-containing domain protein n=1 Tax=Mycena metata TaxID=1033252 RepID=A0AAD7K3P8_9AGAR|nr:WD40-repeat-containing domain protein [Mycena metata]
MSSLSTFHKLKTLHGHDDSINAIAFSPNKVFLASAGADGYIFTYKVAGWKEISRFELDCGAIRALVWHAPSPRSSLFKRPVGTISCGGDNGVLFTIELDTHAVRRGPTVGGAIQCLVLEPEGNLLALGYLNCVEILRIRSGSWGNYLKIPNPTGSRDDHDRVVSLSFRGKKTIVVTHLYSGVVGYTLTGQAAVVTFRLDMLGINSTELTKSGASALSENLRFLAATVMFRGIVCNDLTDTSQPGVLMEVESFDPVDFNLALPIVFVGNTVVIVGHPAGRVAVQRYNRAGGGGALQILEHSGVAEAFKNCVVTIWAANSEPRSSSIKSWRWTWVTLGVLALAAVAGRMDINNKDQTRTSIRQRWESVFRGPNKGLDATSAGNHGNPGVTHPEVVTKEVLPNDHEAGTQVVTKTVEVTRDASPRIMTVRNEDMIDNAAALTNVWQESCRSSISPRSLRNL